jgi:uncharacterized iron-regulated protein
MQRWLLVLGIVFQAAFADAETAKWDAPPIERATVIYDARSQQSLAWDDFIAKLINADVVFLGESHTDETTHQFQLAVYEALLKAKPGKVVLGMEMFERDVQPTLDKYLAGEIEEQGFLKSARPWANYHEAYRPLVEHARNAKSPVLGTNFPAPIRQKMMMEGDEALKKLPEQDRWQVPRELHPNTPAYWKRVDNATRGHQGMMPTPKDEDRLTSTQSLWDNSMGEACADAINKYPGSLVLHLNGGFHSAHWDGTVHQLRLRKPDAKIVTVAIAPASNPGTLQTDQEPAADFIAAVESRATNLDQGQRTVQVGSELAYRLHLPKGIDDKNRVPLLIWLPPDGLTAEEGMEYCRAEFGEELAIAVIDAPYKQIGDDLAVGRRWFWPETFSEDAFRAAYGIEQIWAYLLRHYPIDPARVVIAGEGEGATVVVLASVHANDMDHKAIAINLKQYVKLKDVPLPEFDGRDQPPKRSLQVVAEPEQEKWWKPELEQYRSTEMECEIVSEEVNIRDALGLSMYAHGPSADIAHYLQVEGNSPRELLWARMQCSWLRQDEHSEAYIETKAAAQKRLATEASSSQHPASEDNRPQKWPDQEGSNLISTEVNPTNLKTDGVIPMCPGPFGGTTVLVVPDDKSGELESWLELEKTDPLAKSSRFHRTRIATASGEHALDKVLAKLKSEKRNNILIVPAEFYASPERMRILQKQTKPFADEMTLQWLPGLGGRRGLLTRSGS